MATKPQWGLDYSLIVEGGVKPAFGTWCSFSHVVLLSACMGDGERAVHGRPSLAVRGGLVVNPVDPDGCVMEHGGALGS